MGNKWGAVPPLFSQHLPYQSADSEQAVFINSHTWGTVIELDAFHGKSTLCDSNLLEWLLAYAWPDYVYTECLCIATPHIGPQLAQFRAVRTQNPNPMFSWLTDKRIAYWKAIAESTSQTQAPFPLRYWRYCVSLALPQKGHTMSELVDLRTELCNALSAYGIATRLWQAEDLLSMVHFLSHPTSTVDATLPTWDRWTPLHAQVPDQDVSLSVQSDRLLFTAHDQDEAKLEARVLGVARFPKHFHSADLLALMGETGNPHLQIPGIFALHLQMRAWNKNQAQTHAMSQTLSRKKSAHSPLVQWLPGLRDTFLDWQCIQERLQQDENLMDMAFSVICWSHPQNMPHLERKVRDVFQTQGWRLKNARFLQLPSYIACFPMLSGEGLFRDLACMGRVHTLPSGNAARLLPIVSPPVTHGTPRLLLPTRTGHIGQWCPFDNPTGNYNMAIAAAPGKGKSAFTQEYLVSLLGSNAWVAVIDAGHSYEHTCRLFQGSFIYLQPDKPLSINPFTLIQQLTADTMSLLQNMLAYMARPMSQASEIELALLEETVQCVFAQYGSETNMDAVVQALQAHPHPAAQELAILLAGYTTKGVYGGFFSGPCQWDLETDLWVIELQALKNQKRLQHVVLQVILFLIWQKMYLSDRNRIKSCIIDEAWDLFDDSNPLTAKFIETGYRTARKFRGNFVSITQSLVDYQKNPMSRAAYSCSDFTVLFGQTPESIEATLQAQALSNDTQWGPLLKSLEMNSHYSECLIKGPHGHSCHRVAFDPYSKLLFSSKGTEYQAIQGAMEAGFSCQAALERILGAALSASEEAAA